MNLQISKLNMLVLFIPAATMFIVFRLAPTCNTATYMVGDNPGWDIRTDFDTWPQGKTFHVGDVLGTPSFGHQKLFDFIPKANVCVVFQYSSSDSVEELSKEYYDNCTTTRALQTFSNGNTSIPFTTPGFWFFASVNRLYCLSGMKLQLNVEENGHAGSPASSPTDAISPAAHTQPSTKGDNPFNPTSDDQRRPHSLLHHVSILGFCVMLICLIWAILDKNIYMKRR